MTDTPYAFGQAEKVCRFPVNGAPCGTTFVGPRTAKFCEAHRKPAQAAADRRAKLRRTISQRASERARLAAIVPVANIVHGLNGYQKRRCRCRVCTVANCAATKRYAEKRKEKAA